MGFFENLGRKVEEFKRTAEETAAEEATHVCTACGDRFYRDHDECPACGADAVVERTRDSRDGGGADEPPDHDVSTDTAESETDRSH